MKKQEVADLVYANLSETIRNAGFRLTKSEGAFVRKIPNGLQKIFVPLYDYNPNFTFSLAIGIRLDEVENVFNQFSGAVGKGQALTLTSITQLAYFTTNNPESYKVATPEDINEAFQELSPIMTHKILPFLAHYQDIQSLDKAINEDKQSKFDSTLLINHAMHSLILARLTGNSLYPDLVTDYSKALENFQPFDKERFARLAAFLNDTDFNHP